MASAATIDQWLEELAGSILRAKPNTPKTQTRKTVDGFRRRVRYHNFARTNQFDVQDRLNGLEEKFQVLNRDDLSDALYEQRVQLREHEERWLPDILDLLLRLSDRPVDKTKYVGLQIHDSRVPTSPLLRRADLEADELLADDSPLWKIPSFSDLSSNEDEVDTSTTATSPASARQRPRNSVQNVKDSEAQIFDAFSPAADASNLSLDSPPSITDPSVVVTEIEMIRQALLMLQGYPTNVFAQLDDHLVVKRDVKLHGLPYDVVRQLVHRLLLVRERVDIILNWIKQETSADYVQLIKQELSDIISTYFTWIATFTNRLLHPHSVTAITLLRTIDLAEQNAQDITSFAEYVRNVRDVDPVSCLDHLYNLASRLYFSEQGTESNKVLQTFVKAFATYMKPVRIWVETGNIDSNAQSFFVRMKSSEAPIGLMWHDWYELTSGGPNRPPQYLAAVSQDIFACGKTAAFLRLLDRNSSNSQLGTTILDRTMDEIQHTAFNLMIPFPTAFAQLLQDCFSSILREKTKVLKQILVTACGLDKTLEALDQIYLRTDGMMIDQFESTIFSKIDKCVDNWNDRFLVADMLEEGFNCVGGVDIQSIMVHSAHTSSRSMESRRRSVRILSALAIDYILPWPVANIISKASMGSYRRVALHLSQIRRAKYVLERTAYVHLQQTAISENQQDQKYVQIVVFMLLQFANTLYDHFTATVVGPNTNKMRDDLRTAQSVDEMISVHRTYINKLEFSCLNTKNLKMLKETLIGLLDMCIRFADLVSSSSSSSSSASRLRRNSDDVEASSFISAASNQRRQRRRRRRQQYLEETGQILNDNDDDSDDSDEDDDDDDDETQHEGYSSFIVLEQDTTIVQEIRTKLLVQFRRQLNFFIAGLRAVGGNSKGNDSGERAGRDDTIDEFKILATRLEWKH